jgi:hypothetical protein
LANLKFKGYSRKNLWLLFLLCAFPLHLWTFILIFRDMSWAIERTNVWDAIGVASYGMVFTFVESVAVFIVFALFGLLIPTKWSDERRIALLAVLVFGLALWAMNGQAYFVFGGSMSERTIHYIAGLEHPLRFLYGSTLAMVFPSVAIPAFMVLTSDRFFNLIWGLMDRLSLLTIFYLFFDFIGLLIVVYRNFQ